MGIALSIGLVFATRGLWRSFWRAVSGWSERQSAELMADGESREIAGQSKPVAPAKRSSSL